MVSIIIKENVKKLVTVLDEIKELTNKPNIYEIENGYPLEKLNSRTFELLLYSIFNAEINNGKFKNKFDKVDIMAGVGEQGRDCILKLKNKDVGLIQCKHTINIKTKISETIVVEEVLKFILNYIADNSLIDDINNFTYYMVTNTDFTENAKSIYDEFGEFLKENLEKTEKIIKKIIVKYKQVTCIYSDGLRDRVINISQKIKFARMNQIDINTCISRNESAIAPLFFRMRGYIDTDSMNKIINILDEYINKGKKETYNEEISESIKRYLTWAYDYYTYMKTIVFPNNRIMINELYYPLTIVSTSDGREYVIDGYPNGVIEECNNIMISSTAGMGKSTIMKYMFISAIENKVGIPVFIELKRLSNNHLILDEIIDKIKPIGNTFNEEQLFRLIEKGNFIFFFDGYDEINNEDKKIITENLQLFISKAYNNKFVITSRPETIIGSFNNFQKFKIRDLKLKEAYRIIKLYDKDKQKSKANELIEKIQKDALRNIKEFLKNPLLVSLLYMAYEYKPKIPYKKHIFYEQVYDALFEKHDLMKDGYDRPKHSNLDISDFEKVLRYVGFSTAKKGQVEFEKDYLLKIIKSAKVDVGLDFRENEFLKDLITTVPLFIKDGIFYSWSHKSLQDYFAAKFIEVGAGAKQEAILKKIYQLDDISRFENVLDIFYDIDKKIFKNTILYWLMRDIKSYFNSDIGKELEVNDDFLNERKEKTFGREIIMKLYSEEESQLINSISKGKLRSEYFRNDFNKSKINNWNDDYMVKYNLKRDKVLALFIKMDHNKNELIKILSHKGLTIANDNRNLYLDSKITLPINTFIKINFDKDSYINSTENFKFVNDMLEIGYTINYNQVNEEIIQIERAISQKEIDDILDF